MSDIQDVMGLGSGTAARVAAGPGSETWMSPGTFRPGCPLFRMPVGSGMEE